MNIELYPIKFLKILLYIILFLLCANIMGIISKYYLDHDYVFGLISLFDFNTERNIPTLYSSIALILVSILLSFIALAHRENNASYLPWVFLAIIFLFLSIDEAISIHEQLAEPSRDIFNTSGLLYFAWVIPYGVALLVFVTAYLKFLTQLPNKILVLFLISGGTFVTGAIGFELLGGRHAELFGKRGPMYSFYYTCEESLEMLGIAIFIYTLLTYIGSQFNSLTIDIIEGNEVNNRNDG